ncbi:hypothetical protein E4T39_00496 [Aureobasidium subglaciale]|nr:hypothetical protein E4T39_00496 [Aureobasidium subglaciale]
MFKPPVLTAQDIESGNLHSNGKPWVLVLRPRNDFWGSAWITIHQNAWELILKVLTFAQGVDEAYYQAALVALRRWFYNGAGDPTNFLINLEIQIQEESGRYYGRVREQWYSWRAYTRGPLALTFSRFEDNTPNEPNIAVDQNSAEFFLSEAHVPFFRFCHIRTRALMSDEECRLAVRLERRDIIGIPLTSLAMVRDAAREMYASTNLDMPDSLWPQPPLPDRGSPALAQASPTESAIARRCVQRPHKCPYCRSCFSTVPRRDAHVQTIHGAQQNAAALILAV